MRIAVAYQSRHRRGGTEKYLSELLPLLVAAGQEVLFWSEADDRAAPSAFSLPENVRVVSAGTDGAGAALDELRRWSPDVVFSHSLLSPQLESALMDIAPTVFFAHAYHGTCISGSKSRAFPREAPCARRFGWKCLLHYFPRQCGGSNPVTMWNLYRTQTERLELLPRYAAVLTNSDHMRAEYITHGVPASRAHCVPYGIRATGPTIRAHRAEDPWRILFAGRMETEKGGDEFLAALPIAVDKLDCPLEVHLAGDGPRRASWEQAALEAMAKHSLLDIHFHPWLDPRDLDGLYEKTDLVALPSLWPEPFGLVGVEANARSIPVVAFSVGGIPEWLREGRNGALAPSDPPTAEGLADAIVRCLRDPSNHARLSRGARQYVAFYTWGAHVFDLLDRLGDVVR